MADAAANGAPMPAQKIRHEWYQTDSEVVLSIFVRNIKPEDLQCEILPRSLSVLYKLPTAGSQGAFDLDPLSHEVVPETSSFRALSSKIEVKFAKKTPGIKWGILEGEEQEGHGPNMHAADGKAGPSYPSSSKKKTNWDALAKQAEEDDKKRSDEKDPNAGGDRELNALFQKLYKDATDEQRRAMVKSYQESNGTALSTDWGSVSKGKVETKPPDSMVAKKWGQ